jgi:hypothetical protein
MLGIVSYIYKPREPLLLKSLEGEIVNQDGKVPSYKVLSAITKIKSTFEEVRHDLQYVR